MPLDYGFCPLTTQSLIAVRGVDALAFLHQQLTNSVSDLVLNTFRLGGLCSVKGRLFASMYYWRDVTADTDTVMLLVSHDISAALIKRLSMFVLRAKVKLEDISQAYGMLTLVGPQSTLTKAIPLIPTASGQLVESVWGTLLRLDDVAGQCRLIYVIAHADMPKATAQLSQILPLCPSAVWDSLEIEAGVPRITMATQEQFVPQMINFEILGGVNFKKGCYPGQEIVARSQYRGTIKRRLQRAYVETQMRVEPGMSVVHSADPDQPCGMVVNAALGLHDSGRYDLLVELKLAALTSGSVHLHDVNGPVLSYQALPYSLPAQD
ncbi:MAG: folate-binding protein YgfZ [Ottowia sp.]|nr:folate-binding protein YgfZ [Ottowia sp.]